MIGNHKYSRVDWLDPSPHWSGFARVNGLRLHYLDWGRQGDNLLFLTGLGHSAHIYDDLAPRFTDRFRVLGLTRRGHGASDQPESGYDTDTLVEDLHQFLNQQQIELLRREMHHGHVIEMSETDHHPFLHRPDAVVSEMLDFLGALAPGSS